MTITYTLLEYAPFRSQFDGLNKKVQVEMTKAILRLRTEPYCRECKTLDWELKGIRRIHVGPKYCVAYIVCEECKNESYEAKFGCFDCYKRHWYHIKLISCGPREGFYKNLKKNWESWMKTVAWEKLIQQWERKVFLLLLLMPLALPLLICTKLGQIILPTFRTIFHLPRSVL